MARLPLVGPPGALDSLAVTASECMNLYAEAIENPEDRQKNVAILRKTPGAHEFADTGEATIRGSWSGGGRLFVIAGNKLQEWDIGTYTGGSPSAGAGTLVSSQTLPGPAANDGNPAILFGNANQLGIIANGQFYWDNGAGPVTARFLLQGTVTALGAVLTWTAGNQFTPDMVGRVITLNGQNLSVSAYTSATQITASAPPAGGKAGTVSMAWGGYIVWWASGDSFSPDMVGKPIVIAGVIYTVASYGGTGAITIDSPAPAGTSLAYSTITTQIEYSCDGGDVVTAVTGAYLAGAAWVQRPSGGSPDLGRQVNFSDPFDFTRWRGLNFKTKEAAPDYIQTIHADRGLLFIGGTENSEVWQLDANGLPQRIPGTEVREGVVARWGISSLAQSLFFLGGSPRGQTIAYRMKGFVPQRVSTHAVEKAWANMGVASASAAVSYSYINANGHQWWVLNFPGTTTWAYDVTASEAFGYPIWHQRARWNAGTSAYIGYRYWFHTFIPEWGLEGMHIVGGFDSGKLYEMSDAYGDDAGEDVKWRRAIPYRYNAGKIIYFGRQDIQAEGGTITRDYSDDRGATFVNPEQEMGDGAAYRFWPGGDSSVGRIWRYAGIGQEKVALIDLEADEAAGTV